MRVMSLLHWQIPLRYQVFPKASRSTMRSHNVRRKGDSGSCKACDDPFAALDRECFHCTAREKMPTNSTWYVQTVVLAKTLRPNLAKTNLFICRRFGYWVKTFYNWWWSEIWTEKFSSVSICRTVGTSFIIWISSWFISICDLKIFSKR